MQKAKEFYHDIPGIRGEENNMGNDLENGRKHGGHYLP